MDKMHVYSRRYLIGMLSMICALTVGTGILAGKIIFQPKGTAMTAPTVSASPTGYAVPTGTPSPSLPATDDEPGWDCRVQGNHVCRIDKELWLNLSHLPASLYARCVLGLGATGLSPEVASIDTEAMCEPLYVTQG